MLVLVSCAVSADQCRLGPQASGDACELAARKFAGDQYALISSQRARYLSASLQGTWIRKCKTKPLYKLSPIATTSELAIKS